MDDGLLIEQVQQFKCLYDKGDSKYKNKVVRENAWKTIAVIMDSEAAICEQRWITLRAKYSSLRKKILETPSGSQGYQITWPHYLAMGFVDTFIATRRTSNFQAGSNPTSPQSEAWDTISQMTVSETTDVEDEDITEITPTGSTRPVLKMANREIPRSTVEPKKPKLTKVQEEMCENISTCVKKFTNALENKEALTPEDINFAKSLAADMCILTPEEKILFKRRVYVELSDIVDNRAKF